MTAGRPLKFASGEELQVRMNQYFDDCDLECDRRIFQHDEIIQEGKEKV